MLPVLHLFGRAVQTYYVCAALAALLGFTLGAVCLRKEKLGPWTVLLPLLLVLLAVFGARILNLLTNPDAYRSFSPWTLQYKKLSLMGGIIPGGACVGVFCLLAKKSAARLLDALTVPAAATVVMLKIGCFCNGCCYGEPTEGPFGLVFPANESIYEFINSLPALRAKSPRVHPTQLYEIVGALLALALALLLERLLRRRIGGAPGVRAAVFVAAFCAARWIVLPLRTLPYSAAVRQIFYPCLYAAVIAVCFAWLVIVLVRAKARA